ncbi:MAG: Alpha/beta hydrolase [Myxococcaceae bacterium]|nr:Alpha/beta hydrolase [Myxococcaceae bacterium]
MNRVLMTILGSSLALLAGCRDQPKPAAAESGTPIPTAPRSSTEEIVEPTSTKPIAGAPSPQMQAVLDELKRLGGKPFSTLTAPEARKQPTVADAVKKVLEKQGKPTAPEAVAKVEDRTIPGAAGPLPARVYWPSGAGPFPVVVYFHGGGFVVGSKDTYDASARALTNAASAIVVSVDYRLAPENKFPAAHEDAFAAYEWALANAATLKGDGRRVAVAGEDAGANLAANVSILARDKKVRRPVHQLLIYPVASADMRARSYEEPAQLTLDKDTMRWFFQQTLKDPAQAADPRIDLLHAKLEGLPPTTMLLAEIDPLRGDDETLALELRDASVPIEHWIDNGVTHDFFGTGAVVDRAQDAMKHGAAGLKRGFASVK